jgi:hypothetical protein
VSLASVSVRIPVCSAMTAAAAAEGARPITWPPSCVQARVSARTTSSDTGVAVADDLEVEVVGVLAAGEHGVQLPPGLLPGQQAVHGVGGDALRSMDGGVAETGRLMYVIAGQPDGQVAAGVARSRHLVW